MKKFLYSVRGIFYEVVRLDGAIPLIGLYPLAGLKIKRGSSFKRAVTLGDFVFESSTLSKGFYS